MNRKKIAVIGATGMVGRELISILEEKRLPISKLSLYASQNSAGESIGYNNQELTVKELTSAEQIDADIAFFATSAKVSRSFIQKLSKRCICIDKSSAFRMDRDTPLVVAGVNHNSIDKAHTVIASPNCVATPLAQVLKPIDDLAGLDQVFVSTYQAVSGAGRAASEELEYQVRDLFNLRDANTKIFKKRIAFNVLPLIPDIEEVNALGKTDEEVKLIEETKKILSLDALKIDATCVRVPVFNGHSMAVNIATKREIKISDITDSLNKATGIMLIDEHSGDYPTPTDASGGDNTLVGRIRPNTAAKHGINLWITSDNLRTGAALNAVRIAQTIWSTI